MKLLSWNVNGIRSVSGKGFADWFREQKPDVVCLQEIKALPEQLEESLRNPAGYHSYWHPAEKKGYSGVAIYSKREPDRVRVGLGIPEIDREGRVLIADFPQVTVISTYFPNSQRDHARLSHKLSFCASMQSFLDAEVAAGRNILICGDFNIAHKEIDLRNPKENRNNAGFLPEERAWMDSFTASGYVDTFRRFNQEPGHYTWWSYRPTIRERNIGWRLDYFFCNEALSPRLKSVRHQNEVLGSDHCPVELKLK
jgi:exodeoxyribonuclease-3